MIDENMITVVMALYKPNMKWLEEELLSIKSQTYKKFQVLAWNDCPEDMYDYDSFFGKYLGDISFKIFHGKKNMGSNGVFEKLTAFVDTPYVAYCDQDDIWCHDKLEVLLNTIVSKKATLVFSDMAVIDENSQLVSDNIAGVRPRQKFYEGKDALEHLLAKNFVTGCTMMMKTDVAKSALPFPKSVFHDWWLAVCAAIKGDIAMAPKPLMKYRIYGGNQSSVLKGVTDKKSYYEIRIRQHKDFIDYIVKVFGINSQLIIAQQWSHAREAYYFHPTFKSFKTLLREWSNNPSTTVFEMVLPFIPGCFFKRIIDMVQTGKL